MEISDFITVDYSPTTFKSPYGEIPVLFIDSAPYIDSSILFENILKYKKGILWSYRKKIAPTYLRLIKVGNNVPAYYFHFEGIKQLGNIFGSREDTRSKHNLEVVDDILHWLHKIWKQYKKQATAIIQQEGVVVSSKSDITLSAPEQVISKTGITLSHNKKDSLDCLIEKQNKLKEEVKKVGDDIVQAIVEKSKDPVEMSISDPFLIAKKMDEYLQSLYSLDKCASLCVGIMTCKFKKLDGKYLIQIPNIGDIFLEENQFRNTFMPISDYLQIDESLVNRFMCDKVVNVSNPDDNTVTTSVEVIPNFFINASMSSLSSIKDKYDNLRIDSLRKGCLKEIRSKLRFILGFCLSWGHGGLIGCSVQFQHDFSWAVDQLNKGYAVKCAKSNKAYIVENDILYSYNIHTPQEKTATQWTQKDVSKKGWEITDLANFPLHNWKDVCPYLLEEAVITSPQNAARIAYREGNLIIFNNGKHWTLPVDSDMLPELPMTGQWHTIYAPEQLLNSIKCITKNLKAGVSDGQEV